MKINAIILAAGLSSRMKVFKPLLLIKDKTMIELCVDSVLRADVDQVVVVLGYQAEVVEALLRDKTDCSRLQFAYNHDFATTDMLASVKIGLAALPACDAFYLLPGDMPAIHTETFRTLRKTLSRTGASVVFPVVDGQRRHPPLIDWQCKEDILQYVGVEGLQGLWQRYEKQVAEDTVADVGCLLDADTEADFKVLTEYMEKQQNGGALWKQ